MHAETAEQGAVAPVEQESQTQPPASSELAPQGKASKLIVSDDGAFSNLLDTARFDHLWRVALVFSKSGFVPAHFQNKPENCFVALQMAFRLRVDPLMLMQGIYIVKGKPGMEAKIVIGLVNSRGPFTGPIQYAYAGEEGADDRSCTAYAIHKATGEKCEAKVTLVQAKAKGWYQSNENWRTLTDLMLAYRSATFLARLYAPETLMGMSTVDEVEEVAARFVPSEVTEEGRTATEKAKGLADKIKGRNQRRTAEATPTPEAEASEDANTPSICPRCGISADLEGMGICPGCRDEVSTADEPKAAPSVKHIERRIKGMFAARKSLRDKLRGEIFGKPLAECTIAELQRGDEVLDQVARWFATEGKPEDAGELGLLVKKCSFAVAQGGNDEDTP